MARPVYSTRFFGWTGPGAAYATIVPVGRRAVVRWVSLINLDAGGCTGAVFAAGNLALYENLQAAYSSRVIEARVTVFGGEELKASTEGLNVCLHVSGFLFYEDAAADPPLELVEAPQPDPSLLPVW